MTRTQFAQGSLTFVAVIVAGFISTAQLDRHFVAVEAGKGANPLFGGMRRQGRLLEKLAMVERAGTLAEMQRRPLGQIPRNSTPIISTT